MTKSCGDRIFIGEFIKILEKVNFSELTEEKCKELFVNHDFQWLNKFDDTSKDIAIDDYVFTVHLMSDDEVISKFYRNYNCNGFRINDMVLSNYVEVWLPSDNEGSVDISGHGTIKCLDGIYYMSVEYCVD